MEIANPKRILLLSQPDIDHTAVLKALTKNTTPSTSDVNTPSTTTASPELIHSIKTQYYTAGIPIWIDTISDASSWTEAWKSNPDARDVIDALGAIVFVFDVQQDVNTIKDLLHGIAGVISWHKRRQNENNRDAYSSLGTDETENPSQDQHDEDEDVDENEALANWDGVLLAVGQRLMREKEGNLSSTLASPTQNESRDGAWDPDWEDICLQAGRWEFIDAAAAKGLNEFGELQGLPRLVQALEAVEWDSTESHDQDGFDDEFDDLDDEIAAMLLGGSRPGNEDHDAASSHFTMPSGIDGDIEIQQELHRMIGLSSQDMQKPILATDTTTESTASKHELEDGDENDVDALQAMLLKLQAARDLGADASQAQRRRLAARAVKQVLEM